MNIYICIYICILHYLFISYQTEYKYIFVMDITDKLFYRKMF